MEVAAPTGNAPQLLMGWTHTAFPMGDTSCVGEARRFAAHASAEMDWSDTDTGRLSIVVTELATNLHLHARNGRLLVAAVPALGLVELIAIDHGPGIEDLPRSMRDGYSTGGTQGTGLGAVRRLADDFDIHSSVPQGTVCVARVRRHREPGDAPAAPPQRLRVGAIRLPLAGENVCGDAWAAALDGARAALFVGDGLGHGSEAAKASGAAAALFLQAPFADLREQIEDMHAELQSTRGAAVCSLRLDAEAATVRSTGVGNVVARVVSGLSDRSIVTQHGTVGMAMRRPQETTTALPPYALLVVHSDGIETRWHSDSIQRLLGSDPTLVAAVLMRDHHRSRDDATVVVVQCTE
ncbi:ATP-binding protein [Acidovorax sp. NCPPB 3576]|uniref:ATP-binding protein n=1 Tax=Acidovorax sp. NCPPB 3576 TaxID=2940488 RepID=UPI002349EC18|nr:ATP-binding protein [Acidovorax sp. NCPPB 3576]WCM86471.1 SpoIIE family protein phosphatase [Acidovorax sp. NCPPB 3576]